MERNKNIIKFILELTALIVLLVAMFIFIKSGFRYAIMINSICSCLVGVIIKIMISTIVDLYDSMPWQTYLRAFIRAKEITKKTNIRISYAYLFRIEVDGKYFLIMNSYGIGKMQPPGHTYRISYEEKEYLKDRFQIMGDDKLNAKKIKNDYRFRVKAAHLKKFYKRFCYKIDVEKTENYFDGFKDTLIRSGYLDENIFKEVVIKDIRRDIQRISYSKYFDCYEMIVHDIKEIVLTDIQREYMRSLMSQPSNRYIFATDKYIKSLGVDPEKNDYYSEIADHSLKILP